MVIVIILCYDTNILFYIYIFFIQRYQSLQHVYLHYHLKTISGEFISLWIQDPY